MLTVSFLSLLVANTAASANLALQGFYWTLCGICKAQQTRKRLASEKLQDFLLGEKYYEMYVALMIRIF